MTRPLHIAWVGPAPHESGGVAGMATQVIDGLADLGHSVDCYVPLADLPLPERLQGREHLTLHVGPSRWRYGAWYSRTPLSTYLSGQATRAFATRRLGELLARNHARDPYDVVYQFSNIELLGLRRHLDRLPPLVLHPETHIAGELRGLRDERALVRQCEGLARRVAVGAMLAARTAVQRRDAPRAHRLICPSRVFRSRLIEDYGIDEERTVVVPNPVDLSLFRRRTVAPANGRPLRVLFIGRISVRKGIDAIVELSRRLRDLTGTVELEVIGDRTQWSDYRPLLADLDPSVGRYRGGVPSGQVPIELAAADVLVQPSTYEPFGLTLAEALASGVPAVVTTEVGAAEDVTGECVSRVPPGDPDALETAVRALLERMQDGSAERLRAEARAEAERLFDPARVCGAIAHVLREAAG